MYYNISFMGQYLVEIKIILHVIAGGRPHVCVISTLAYIYNLYSCVNSNILTYHVGRPTHTHTHTLDVTCGLDGIRRL